MSLRKELQEEEVILGVASLNQPSFKTQPSIALPF